MQICVTSMLFESAFLHNNNSNREATEKQQRSNREAIEKHQQQVNVEYLVIIMISLGSDQHMWQARMDDGQHRHSTGTGLVYNERDYPSPIPLSSLVIYYFIIPLPPYILLAGRQNRMCFLHFIFHSGSDSAEASVRGR